MHSADRWRGLTALLPVEWDIYVVELPGFGLSPIEPADQCSIPVCARMLEDTIGELRDETRRSILVSHSLGGLVALGFQDTCFDCEVYSAVPACGLPNHLWVLGNENLTRLCLRLNAIMPERVARAFARRAARVTVCDPSFIDELMVEDALRADPYVAARMAKEMYDYALDQCRADGHGTCLVVHAELDQVVTLEDSQELAAFLGTDLITIADSGHTLMSEAPEPFADVLVSLAGQSMDS